VPCVQVAEWQAQVYQLSQLVPLDVPGVRQDLLAGDADLIARLLQALRWRYTKCCNSLERFAGGCVGTAGADAAWVGTTPSVRI